MPWPLLWRIVWTPFWVGSDVPPPALPAREPALPAAVGLAGVQVARTLDRLARRVWLQRVLHILVRAAWLGPAVGCAWLAVELLGGPALDVDRLIGVAAVFGALGVVFAALARPTRRQVARMLDRSFGLQERMVTAVGNLGLAVPREGERAPVIYLQMADAANVVAEARRHRAFALRPPVRELVLTVACGLLMAALFFLRGVGGDIPAVAAGAVPVFTPAVDRPPEPVVETVAPAAEMTDVPSTEEVRRRAERSNQAQRDLQALSHALSDHAVTRDAAEAIQRGEYATAADQLRATADNADQLSEAARQELANDLDLATTEMSSESGDLSQAAQAAAAGLREGNEAAQEGVRQLGDAVEETGSEIASQEELADQMRQAQAAEAQQGGSDAQPGDAGQQRDGAGQRTGSQDERSAGQSGEAGEGADAEPGESGAEGAPSEGDEGAPSQNQAPGQRRGGENGEGQGGEQAGERGEGEGQPGGQGGQPGDDPRQGGEASGEGERSQAGGGAGTGRAESGAEDGQAGQAGEGGEEAGQGVPAEQRVTEGEGQGGAGQETDDAADVTQAIELPRAESGEGVQTSNDAGSSSLGSGSGVTAGNGTAVQGEVGDSGPDSNRVPAEYRSLVERYFSDPGANP